MKPLQKPSGVRGKGTRSAKPEPNVLRYDLPDDIRAGLTQTFKDWESAGKVGRLWERDASLWTGKDESNWLGWLSVTEEELERLAHLDAVASEVRGEKYSHAVVLGMGGSSLCPYVLSETFGSREGYPRLFVLDSTDPAQIRSTLEKLDFARTIFIVSSKSGTTLEPNILMDYFLERVREEVGGEEAGAHFLAITDPGSKLEGVALRECFRKVCYGVKEIGGRFSALSDFGMVPAAIMGLDVRGFLERADAMRVSCAPRVPVRENPGAVLGAILGVSANEGRDKVTLVASPGITRFGVWLEQLLAESTGKEGKGIVPVDGEPVGPPEVYENDRLFVYLRLGSAPDPLQDQAVYSLERAGHPVVRIGLDGAIDLAREFYRWMFATAVSGSVMGVNPFDQPDVEASKAATKELVQSYEREGGFPCEAPLWQGAGVSLFTDPKNAESLGERVGGSASLEAYLGAHLDGLDSGDYFALLAYIDMNPSHSRELERIRLAVRDSRQVATCLGFGPRFLHSTGQLYKGGPDSGVFLQITCDDRQDIGVPGRKYTFGAVKAAQALGDFRVLAERGRRMLRIHLSLPVGDGLVMIRRALDRFQ